MNTPFELGECNSTSTSSKMVSALSNVSEKAKKSLFISFSHPLNKLNSESNSMENSNNETSDEIDALNTFNTENSKSFLSSSIENTSPALVKRDEDKNSHLGEKYLDQDQKKKQNNFFKKLEAHSLSLSSVLFGKEIIENNEKMNELSTNISNDLNFETKPVYLSNVESAESIKIKMKPVGTLEYKVELNDTIEKIALKWNTVPSEIQHLNRLVTRVIFPGQVLYVPDPNYSPIEVIPNHFAKVEFPVKIDQEPKELEASLKKENNSKSSLGFKFFKWKTTPSSKPGHVELQKQKCLSEPTKSSSENLNRNKLVSRHTLTEEEAKKLDEECTQRFLKVNCKIVTRSKGCYSGVLIITPSALMFDPLDPGKASKIDARRDSYEFNSRIYDEASAIIPIEIISNVIMYEDLALKDVQEYFDYQHHIEMIESDLDEKKNMSNNVKFELNENEVADDTIHFESTKQNEENNNEVFEKNDLSSTKLTNELNDDEISSIASSSTNSSIISCYLCIKVNKNKDFISCPLNRKMKNRLTSEFWFQIKDDSYRLTDKICAFFLQWKCDNTYTITDEQVPKSRFQLVKPDELTEIVQETIKSMDLSNKLKKNFSTTNRLINKSAGSFVKDWEVVNIKELELKIKQEIEIEKEYNSLPKLSEPSSILKEEHLRKLNVNLIPRAVGYDWTLSFSTDLHGFSLNTLYRQLIEIESPCLVVLKDSNNNIFGAMSSCNLYPSEHYYGTGESFLFSFTPSFKIFKWTGENNFFIRGNADGLGFGCAEGYHGLWFDGDLLNGHSQRSKTFDNDQLSSTEEFLITAMEVWSFSD